MSDGLIEGFERRRLPGDGIEVDALVGGSGPPLLLLHGYPQTRVCWREVATRLADRFTLVIPDLRGYGRTDKPKGGGDHAAYSKRTMARDQIATMKALGFERFRVGGHDRGGRVAYRLALDHPETVMRLAVIDIVPTADVWSAMDAKSAVKMWHWTFQAQDGDLPERLIGGDPEFFLRWTLEKQAGPHFAFDPGNMDDYVACIRDPATIHGLCEDYRAGWGVDRELDEQDKGRRKIMAPMLVLWGEDGTAARSQPLEKWGEWADEATGHALPGGHFVPEEAGAGVVEAFASFFGD